MRFRLTRHGIGRLVETAVTDKETRERVPYYAIVPGRRYDEFGRPVRRIEVDTGRERALVYLSGKRGSS
jgi:hypothetical protein